MPHQASPANEPEPNAGSFTSIVLKPDCRHALNQLEAAWDNATDEVRLETLERIWRIHSEDPSITDLHELIKYDQYRRIHAGFEADLYRYLNHFPELQQNRKRLVSLAYSEFCAMEDLGQKPETEAFCKKYQEMSDSLSMQFAIHEMLSIPSNELQTHESARHFPKVGQVVEHFELDRELGRGGTARVYLARDLNLGRRAVALKISGDQSTEPEILAKLDHDNIVPVLSAQDTGDGLRLICMPFRGSMTLERLFNKFFAQNASKKYLKAGDFRKHFELNETSTLESGLNVEGPEGGWKDFPDRGNLTIAIAWVGWKLARALAHAHTLKVYHRDIKPANILISRKSGPQLLDFNMARDPDAMAQVEDRIRGGTLPYMAPEQLGAFLDPSLWAEICEQADIFSLGLVLQEWIRGRRVEIPLAATEPVKQQARALLRQRSQPWVSLRTENREVSCALDAVLAKALAFEPYRRYKSAQHFADDLKSVIDGKPLRWAWNPSRKERWLTSLRPYRKIVAAAVLVFVIFQLQGRYFQPPPPILPGVSKEITALVAQKKYDAAFRLLSQTAADQGRSTEFEIIRLIVWSQAIPSDEKAYQQTKELVEHADLDQAIDRVRSAIGQERHLDFLPIFRDYCRLNDFQQRGTRVAPLDWQNLERRFFDLQTKWPEDLRISYYLATLAAKRADFQAAVLQLNRAMDQFNKSRVSQNETIRKDLQNKSVAYQFQAAVELQRANQPEEALARYVNCHDLIKQFRRQNKTESSQQLEWLELEIAAMIGQGDCMTDQTKYKAATLKYQNAQHLVDQNEDQLAKQLLLEKLRVQLNQRLGTILTLQNQDVPAVK